jgi:hypothetical protein
MSSIFSGFRQFVEGDDQLDSIGQTAWELGFDPKDLASQPYVGGGISLGGKSVMAGLSSYDIVKVTDRYVVLRIRDEGYKRVLKTPSGYARDPSRPDTPRTVVVPRDQFVSQLWDKQYQQSPGAAPPGGPPLGI